jgi:outer membrane protein assembly factor BamB
VALRHDGEERWSRDYGRVNGQHGIGGSLVLYKGLVVLTQEQWVENRDGLESRWLGVEQKDGAIRWALARRNGKTSFGTPSLFVDASGRDQLIFASQVHGITAIAPSEGKVLWELSDCFQDRTVASVVVAGGLVIGTAGGGGVGKTLVLVKPGQERQPAKLLYATDIKGQIPYVPSTIALGDRLYLFYDRGTISCWALPTGQPLWTEPFKARFYGSPVAIGDTIYCVTRKGDVVILKAGDTFQLLGRNPLGEACQTTPAVANNRLYVRTVSALVCVSGARHSRPTLDR